MVNPNARHIDRGKLILGAMGSAANAVDRAALHAYDATKAIIRPGEFATNASIKDALLNTPVGRKALWTGVAIPSLVALSTHGAKDTMNEAMRQGQGHDSGMKTAGIGNKMRDFFGGARKAMGGVKMEGAMSPMMEGGAAVGKSMATPLLAAAVGGAGLGSILSQPDSTMGYQLNKGLFNNSLMDRVQADEVLMENFLKGLGGQAGKTVADMGRQGIESAGGAMQNAMVDRPKQRNVLNNLTSEDEILSGVNPEDINQAYGTLSRFAPTLATDPNAVRSFLREAATTGGGADYASIANLARAEQTVNPMYKRGSAQPQVKLSSLMSRDSYNRIRANGLHKLAAVKLATEGYPVGNELTLRGTITVLGHKLREKNATAKTIVKGLTALKALQGA